MNNIDNFLMACDNGDLQSATKYYCDELTNSDLMDAFRSACTYGHMEIIKFLTPLYEEMRVFLRIEPILLSGLQNACETGQLDIVMYLVDTKDLTKPIYNTQKECGNTLKFAAKSNDITLFEYVLDNIVINQKYNEEFIKEAYISACNADSDNIVKHLLEDSKYNSLILSDDSLIKTAFYDTVENNAVKVINYFIIENPHEMIVKVELNQYLISLKESNQYNDTFKKIYEYINSTILNKEMEINLPFKSENKTKNKI